LLKAALRDAKLQAQDISYIEAHGTGTKLGDPVEVQALVSVYGKERDRDNPLLVGGIKANVGHLEPSAGLAGLVAGMLVLNKQEAPPNANLVKLNPKIQEIAKDCPIAFPQVPKPIATDRMLVGISSFGYSGIISHVIIGMPPMGFERRALSNSEAHKRETRLFNAESKTLWQFPDFDVSLFSSVPFEMYEESKEFKEQMEKADNVFRELGLPTMKETIFTPGVDVSKEMEKLNDAIHMSHPMFVALQLCLARTWYSRGSYPSALLGYSLGDYTVGILSEAFSLRDGLWLVYQRALLLQESKQHDTAQICSYIMRTHLAVVDSAVKKLKLEKEIFITNYNMANYLVLSGTDRGMKALTKALGSKVPNKKLSSKVMLHSPFAMNISEKFKALIENIAFSPGVIPTISTVGEFAQAAFQLSSAFYWTEQLISSVQYYPSILKALEMGLHTFVEFGTSTLSGWARTIASSHISADGSREESLFVSALILPLSERPSDTKKTLEAVKGADKRINFFTLVNWKRRIYRPTHRLLQDERDDTVSGLKVYTCRIHRGLLIEWLEDHQIRGKVVLPGAAMIEMCLAGVFRNKVRSLITIKSLDAFTISLRGFVILSPKEIGVGGNIDKLMEPHEIKGKKYCSKFNMTYDQTNQRIACNNGTTVMSEGLFEVQMMAKSKKVWVKYSQEASRKKRQTMNKIDCSDLYVFLAKHGLQLGTSFQLITHARVKENEILCTLSLVNSRELKPYYLVPPPLLDALLQSCAVLLKSATLTIAGDANTQVPFSFDQI
ncbi:acyltransferase domain-containing protein, partial [archaeon]